MEPAGPGHGLNLGAQAGETRPAEERARTVLDLSQFPVSRSKPPSQAGVTLHRHDRRTQRAVVPPTIATTATPTPTPTSIHRRRRTADARPQASDARSPVVVPDTRSSSSSRVVAQRHLGQCLLDEVLGPVVVTGEEDRGAQQRQLAIARPAAERLLVGDHTPSTHGTGFRLEVRRNRGQATSGGRGRAGL